MDQFSFMHQSRTTYLISITSLSRVKMGMVKTNFITQALIASNDLGVTSQLKSTAKVKDVSNEFPLAATLKKSSTRKK